MSSQAHALEERPIRTFEGVDTVLELFNDRIVMRRTDPLATYMPGMFNETRTLDLKDIAAVHLHDSKYIYNRWLMLVIRLTNHKHISMPYARKDHPQAEEIKHAVDAFISHRQAASEANA